MIEYIASSVTVGRRPRTCLTRANSSGSSPRLAQGCSSSGVPVAVWTVSTGGRAEAVTGPRLPRAWTASGRACGLLALHVFHLRFNSGLSEIYPLFGQTAHMARIRKSVPTVVVLAVASAFAVSGGPLAASAAPHGSAAADTAPGALPSVVPDWAKTDTVLGTTPADQTVYVLLTLASKDAAGEQAYGVAVSTPGNALYQEGLTKAQFQQRFGAVDGSADAVTAGLRALGVSDIVVDKLGVSVLATMSAATASTIFGVTFQQVEHDGESTRVATSEPTLPASLAPYVSVVSGLTQTIMHTDHTALIPAEGPTPPASPEGGAPTAYFNGTPASLDYYGSSIATDKPTSPVLAGDSSTTKPYVIKGYKPPQIRGAYDVDKVTYTGKGVTTGVVLFYDGPDVAADLNTFSTAFGLATPVYNDLSPQNEGTSIAGGNAPVVAPLAAAAEQTLDVESIHQMAPDAVIDYSGATAPENGPIDVALDTLIAAGVAVINNSYGSTGGRPTQPTRWRSPPV